MLQKQIARTKPQLNKHQSGVRGKGMPGISVFDPNAQEAKHIFDLFSIVLIICAIILAIVTGLVVYSLWRFRSKPGQGEPRQLRGHLPLEVLWTAVPLLILVFLFVLTVRVMNAIDAPTRDPDIEVIGHQFWWEVRYPKAGLITANEIHIPAGQRLLLRVKSADVIHAFWVPQLSRKMDMLPGPGNHIWLQAAKPGLFKGACSEFCGMQHAWMLITVIAEPAADYEAWLRQQLQPVPVTGSAARGEALYNKLTCVTCHPMQRDPQKVQTAPDLNHLVTRQTLGAGVLQNNPQNLARWLRNPQAVKPGNLMPNMQLTEQQVSDLVDYLLRRP